MEYALLIYRPAALLSIPKIQTDLLWVLTLSFAGVGLLYFISIFWLRNKLTARAELIAKRKKDLAPMISNFLFYDDSANKEETSEYLAMKLEIRDLLKYKFNRKVMAEILLDLQKDVSGDARQKLCQLYKDLGLHQDAFARLGSRRWEVVSGAILELTAMQVEEAYGFIRRFINHRKSVVRKQAQIATVSLRPEGISYFLDTCRYKISEWQQLKLLDVIRHLDDFQPPRFKAWLTFKNNDVVLFALRLIKYYKQNDAERSITQLVKHKSVTIRLAAVDCIKEFHITEALPALKKAFRRANTELKLQILDTIANLGDTEDLEFLYRVERSESNFIVKSKAISAMNAIKPESVMPMEGIQEPVPGAGEDQENRPPIKEIQMESKPNNSEREESEKDQIQDNAQEAKDVPGREEEDMAIFDICAKEEFDDIVEEARQEEEEAEILPLDFLPLIREEKEDTAAADNTLAIRDIEVEAELVSDEIQFRKELSDILENIGSTATEAAEPEEEELELDFLPVVTSCEPGQTDELNWQLEQEAIRELAVIYEELGVAPADEGFDRAEVAAALRSDNQESEPIDWTAVVDAEKVLANAKAEVSDPEEEAIGDALIGFSIFRELFAHYDRESKLLLLDELIHVGEEKELRFLESLSQDADARIRKKAAAVATKLRARLELDNPEAKDMFRADNAEDAEAESSADDRIPLEYCLFQASDPEEEGGGVEIDFDGITPVEEENALPASQDEQGPQRAGTSTDELLSLNGEIEDKKDG